MTKRVRRVYLGEGLVCKLGCCFRRQSWSDFMRRHLPENARRIRLVAEILPDKGGKGGK